MTTAKTLPQAPETHRGMTFGFGARNGYFETAAARTEVDRTAELGVRWVCLVSPVMQETATSSRRFRDFADTPSDYELMEIIDVIHAKGMKVHLRPMIECYDGHGRTQVWFPQDGERIPGRRSTAMDQWFASMRARTRHDARLATKAGSEMYGLDSELDRFGHFNKEGREMVQVAREHFAEPVTSCHSLMVDFLKELQKEDHWFRDLDVLGTSFYHPSASVHGARVESRVEFLKPKVRLYPEMASAWASRSCSARWDAPAVTRAESSPAGGAETAFMSRRNRPIISRRSAGHSGTSRGGPYSTGGNGTNRTCVHSSSTTPRATRVHGVGKPARQVMKAWFSRQERAWT